MWFDLRSDPVQLSNDDLADALRSAALFAFNETDVERGKLVQTRIWRERLAVLRAESDSRRIAS